MGGVPTLARPAASLVAIPAEVKECDQPDCDRLVYKPIRFCCAGCAARFLRQEDAQHTQWCDMRHAWNVDKGQQS